MCHADYSRWSIDMLTSTNHHTWKYTMKALLVDKEVYKILDGTEAVPEGAGDEAKV